MSLISQGKLILSSCQICGFVLGGYKIIQTCYLAHAWLWTSSWSLHSLIDSQRDLDFLLAFFLFKPLFPFSPFFVAISKLCLRSLFLFMLYFLFSTFSPPSVPEGLCDLSLQLLYTGLCYSLWPVPQLDAFTFSEAITEKYVLDIQSNYVQRKKTKQKKNKHQNCKSSLLKGN